MNVKELKNIIENLPDDLLVVVKAYEEGFCSPKSEGVLPIALALKEQDSSIYGKYQIGYQIERSPSDYQMIGEALVLRRQSASEENGGEIYSRDEINEEY